MLDRHSAQQLNRTGAVIRYRELTRPPAVFHANLAARRAGAADRHERRRD
jgi:hypothetical protein